MDIMWLDTLPVPPLQPDDAARFMFFSRAAIEFLHRSGKSPDVLHVHDWQVGGAGRGGAGRGGAGRGS